MKRYKSIIFLTAFLILLSFSNCSNHLQQKDYFSFRTIPSKYGMVYDAKIHQSDLFLLTSKGIVKMSKDTDYSVSEFIDASFERHSLIYAIQDDVLVTLEEIHPEQERYSFFDVNNIKLIGSYVLNTKNNNGKNLFLSENLSVEPIFYTLNNNVFQKVNIKDNHVIWSVEIPSDRINDIYPVSSHRFLFVPPITGLQLNEHDIVFVMDQKDNAIVKRIPFHAFDKIPWLFYFRSISQHEFLLEDFPDENTYKLYKITITEDSNIEVSLLYEIDASIRLNQINVRLVIDKQNENVIVVFYDSLIQDKQKLDIQMINLKTGKRGSISKKDLSILQQAMQDNNTELENLVMNDKSLFIINSERMNPKYELKSESPIHSHLLNAVTGFNTQTEVNKVWSLSLTESKYHPKLSILDRFFFGEQYFCYMHENGIELYDTQSGTLVQRERTQINLKGGKYFCLYDDMQDTFFVITENTLILIN